MKRVFALFLALVMVMSLGITAFATESTGTGSIEITNAIQGHTYQVYKIFDADYVVDAQGNTAVTYTINKYYTKDGVKTLNPVFEYLFGKDGTQTNTYFSYEADVESDTFRIMRTNEGTNSEVCTALTDMIRAGNHTGIVAEKEAKEENLTANKTLMFENLPYGYYLIDKDLGVNTNVAVTIDSNTPDVKVIDKNQKPNSGDSFDKLVLDKNCTLAQDAHEAGVKHIVHYNELGQREGCWAEANTASVGDMMEYQIAFNATNHDGELTVQYYSVRDTKSSSLWIEFNEIQVFVNGEELTKGYYYCAKPSVATSEWTLLGSGWEAGAVYENVMQEAEWYLVHYGYDDIEIVIPWLTNHTFVGKVLEADDNGKGYELKFDQKKNDVGEVIPSEFRYGAATPVKITYTAAVGYNAVGKDSVNTAKLEWTHTHGTTGPDEEESTTTKVYNMGIDKIADDGKGDKPATGLAGAVFQIWKDSAYKMPVNVIPIGISGVYVLDDVDNPISGTNRVSAREHYYPEGANGELNETLNNWLKEDPHPNFNVEEDTTDFTANRRNDVVSPAGGKIVILGLDEGIYYLEEVQAPVSYNRVTTPIPAYVHEANGEDAKPNWNYVINFGGTGHSVYATTVENSRGMELPSTGGKGTMMMITFGCMVAMAFAVLLITQKKMTVYHD